MLLDRHHLRGHHESQVHLIHDQDLEAPHRPRDLNDLLLLGDPPLHIALHPGACIPLRRREIAGVERVVAPAGAETAPRPQPLHRRVEQPLQFRRLQPLHGIGQGILVHRPLGQVAPLAEAALQLRRRVADQLQQRPLAEQPRRHQVDRPDPQQHLQLVGQHQLGNRDHHPHEAPAFQMQQRTVAHQVQEAQELRRIAPAR